MPRGVDPEILLASYHLALNDLPIEAVESVVVKLVRGTWFEEVKYCPRPPELAGMVRREHARMVEAAKPHVPLLPAYRSPFRTMASRHKERAEELASDGWRMFCTCSSQETFVNMARGKRLPAGSTFLWGIGEVWAPPQPAIDERSAA